MLSVAFQSKSLNFARFWRLSDVFVCYLNRDSNDFHYTCRPFILDFMTSTQTHRRHNLKECQCVTNFYRLCKIELHGFFLVVQVSSPRHLPVFVFVLWFCFFFHACTLHTTMFVHRLFHISWFYDHNHLLVRAQKMKWQHIKTEPLSVLLCCTVLCCAMLRWHIETERNGIGDAGKFPDVISFNSFS